MLAFSFDAHAEAPVTPPPVPSFAEQVPPPAPDYAAAANWAARPGAEGAAALVPPGATPATSHARVDVFYVHPTTVLSKARWNADVADGDVNHWTDISVVARQASMFNGCCRIFAPRYRQASTLAFAAMGGEGDKAYDLAFADVERAFDWYIAHDNGGRPFILVGHSQGALMVKRLLLERVEGTPLAHRMVAAYIFGLGISQGDFGRTFRTTLPCTQPAQTGCVIGWNSFLAGNDPTAYLARSTAPYRAQYGDEGSELLCSDPLSLSGATVAAMGTLPGKAKDGPLQPLVPNAVSAQCVKGELMVQPDPALGLTPLPGGNMHFNDMQMFYADIRADALRRVKAFLATEHHR